LVLVAICRSTFRPDLLFLSFSSGLVEIIAEKTTQDGEIADSLKQATIVALQDQLIRAADGASFGTKDALYVP
jgi:hypothetical protein